jgi:hypothetical protein
MKISKIHQAFSELLEQPDALTNPAKYLGPNYQDVLNFWIYVDSLNDEEKEEMRQRYWTLNYRVRWSAIDAARDAAEEVVGLDFRCAAFCAARGVTRGLVFCYATEELIGHHKFINKNKLLIALQCCVK